MIKLLGSSSVSIAFHVFIYFFHCCFQILACLIMAVSWLPKKLRKGTEFYFLHFIPLTTSFCNTPHILREKQILLNVYFAGHLSLYEQITCWLYNRSSYFSSNSLTERRSKFLTCCRTQASLVLVTALYDYLICLMTFHVRSESTVSCSLALTSELKMTGCVTSYVLWSSHYTSFLSMHSSSSFSSVAQDTVLIFLIDYS